MMPSTGQLEFDDDALLGYGCLIHNGVLPEEGRPQAGLRGRGGDGVVKDGVQDINVGWGGGSCRYGRR